MKKIFRNILLYYIVMGCDYFILKLLHIYYSNSEYLEIELDRQRGYYDDDEHEENINKYIEYTLTPKTEDIVIYNNNNFNKPSLEEKYKIIIENKIRKYRKKWCEIKKIIKVEERHER
jgi:chromosomal replication initiation ATPase DnaA